MIDMLVLRLPFIDSLVCSRLSGNDLIAFVDLSKIATLSGINLSARTVEYHIDGDLTVSGLSHPFESLPTHYSGIAFKIYEGSKNFYPCVEIKASPSKVLQGHNVFGTTDLALCSEALLLNFANSLPCLYDLLDVNATTISRIDATFSARAPNENIAKQVIDHLRNVSNGQTKSTRSQNWESTVIWNETSRHRTLVAYLKHVELQHYIQQLSSKPSAKMTSYQKEQLKVLSNPDLLEFASGLVRFEARIKTRYLKSFGLPLNLFDAIRFASDYNSQGKDLIFDLWSFSFSELFKAFEGDSMNIYDDSAVLDAIQSKHFTITPSGKTSFAKASRYFGFYRRLVNEGYDSVALTMPRNSFWRYVSALVECGIPKSQLMNLSTCNNVVPLVRFINVDFSSQRPDWYNEPVLKIA